MKPINSKRKKFCRLVAAGETGAGAYRKAYKSTNNNTSKRNAHRLLQQPGVLLYLAVIQGAAMQAGPPAAGNAAAPKQSSAQKVVGAIKNKRRQINRRANRRYEIMDDTECRVLLSRIARGQIFTTRYMVVKGAVIEKPMPPGFAQRRDCIALLNKIRGTNA